MELGVCALLLCASSVLAQKPSDRPPPLDPIQGEREARALVADLLAQKPDQNTINTGQMKIRDDEGKQREVLVRFEIAATATNSVAVYETLTPRGEPGGVRLTIIHPDGQPNQYQLLERAAAGGTNAAPRNLSGKESMMSFAGSDFWLADLGLEFLHWSNQRLLRKEMRHSQPCGVLESINPEPARGGYARVVSWIDLEAPHGVVHADAFDANHKRIKQFDPKAVKKVQGQYQLEAMEMLDERTGSRTEIRFDLKGE